MDKPISNINKAVTYIAFGGILAMGFKKAWNSYNNTKHPNNIDMSTVQSMVAELGKKKTPFLDDVESSINSYISHRSWQECLTIVERYSDGSVRSTWEPSEILEGYVNRLIAFLRKKKYDGYELDSKLTDGVVVLVTKKFEEFYSKNAGSLAKPLLQQLMNDKVFVNKLADQIIDVSKGPLPTAVKSRLTSHLIYALEDSMQINISQIASDSIHTLTTHVVAAAASVPISKAVAVVLLKNMAIFLKGAVAKVMATTAVKTMLATTIKKLVAVKIVAALIALVAPALGSISIWWIVAPLLAAFIAYEVSNLPENMGKKVSLAVRQELSGEFDNLNKNVVTQIMGGLTSSALGVLASDIAKDEIFKGILDKYNK